MAIFYVLQESVSYDFLSDLKLGHWDGYFDPTTEQYSLCEKFSSRKAAFLARAKAEELLRAEFPNDPEAAFNVKVLEVRTEVIKKIVHTAKTL